VQDFEKELRAAGGLIRIKDFLPSNDNLTDCYYSKSVTITITVEVANAIASAVRSTTQDEWAIAESDNSKI